MDGSVVQGPCGDHLPGLTWTIDRMAQWAEQWLDDQPGCVASNSCHALLASQRQNWVLDFRWRGSLEPPQIVC